MGFPLSRFQLMSGLFSGEERCVRALSGFKMVCIVLPDPYDSTFQRMMRDRFSVMHQRTGKDMLFISFNKPPKDWDRLKYKLDFETVNLYAEPGCDDDRLINSFIRAVAPDAMLPSIIVTDDLMTGEYVVLESSRDRIEEQLAQIGEFCTFSDGRVPVRDQRFQKLLAKLGRFHIRSADRPLAASLADVLAVLPENYFEFSREWAERRLEELRLKVESGDEKDAFACRSYELAIPKEMEVRPIHGECCSRPKSARFTLKRSSIVTAEEIPTFYQRYKIDVKQVVGFESCHALSKGILHQYNEQIRRLIAKRRPSEDDFKYIDARHTIIRNYGAITYCFNDFLEREINLSLVQLMRQHFGIEMPEFYLCYKPDKNDAIVHTWDKAVNLNSLANGELARIPLGQAFYSYLTMCNPCNGYGMVNAFGPDFMPLWKKLFRYRNYADHPQMDAERVIDYQRFDEQYVAFVQFLDGYLGALMTIKERLRGS